MNQYERRLKRLEKKQESLFPDVLEWIKKGRFYDDLTLTERQKFCDYYFWGDRRGFEECVLLFADGDESALHFVLERKPKPPTDEEMEKIRLELDEYFRAR